MEDSKKMSNRCCQKPADSKNSCCKQKVGPQVKQPQKDQKETPKTPVGK